LGIIEKDFIEVQNELISESSLEKTENVTKNIHQKVTSQLNDQNQEKEKIKTIVLIDGSNVAKHKQLTGDKPFFKNITLAYDYYTHKGFHNIRIICDANLKYNIDIGQSRFDEALRTYRWLEQSPSGVKADKLIFRIAAEFPDSIVISNDNFNKPEDYNDWPDIDNHRHRFHKFDVDFGKFFEL
jgi:hypothetical protein